MLLKQVMDRLSLWVFDFDGTISEFVSNPAEAEIHPACRDLLRDLASRPLHRVAILSSRHLDDVVPRTEIPGVYVGGGSGMEWLCPSGERLVVDSNQAVPLGKNRRAILPVLRRLEQIPGIELEDKRWSVAVHVQRAPGVSKYLAERYLSKLSSRRMLRFFKGRDVFEVPFLAGLNKAFGVRKISEILYFQPGANGMVYAGDDENDATAMEWVVQRGGVAFAVGKTAVIPAARRVSSPDALAAEIRRLFKVRKEHEALSPARRS